MTAGGARITPLLAGMDTVYFSCDLPVSDGMRKRLTQEKTVARARRGAVGLDDQQRQEMAQAIQGLNYEARASLAPVIARPCRHSACLLLPWGG